MVPVCPDLANVNPKPSLEFERDTFAYANELFWEYRIDPATGATTTVTNRPPPTYAHRCFVMVRAARQFLYHARFEPLLPSVDENAYRTLVRTIVSRNPRRASAEVERVVVPGYGGLRAFSQAREPLLKAECGGPWASYFLRSHWRMVFPVWPRHQELTAERLERVIREAVAPVVHLFRFPHVTINHGVVLFGVKESGRDIEFDAYDPNIPAHPVKLIFERGRRSFYFPRTHYWAGGPLKVIEILRGGLY